MKKQPTPKHARPKQIEPRWRKLVRIGQAHLAPGMSLQRLRDILKLYNVGDSWADVSDATVDAIVSEIAVIVKKARGDNGA